MKTFVRNLLCVGVVSLICLGLGCGNRGGSDGAGATDAGDGTAATGTASASTLPEAPEVMASLDKKDWDGAVGAVMRARQGVSTLEQEKQYTILVDEVKLRLIDEGPGDPKAGEAMQVLRQFTSGR